MSAALLAAVLLTADLSGSTASGAEPQKGRTYHFGTHAARTSISFVSDAEFETIHGTTNRVQGSIAVDATGTKASGTLRVGVRTLDTGIAERDRHLRTPNWLDAEKHPWIVLKIDLAQQGKGGTWTYSGKLTLKGVTMPLKGKARLLAFPKDTTPLGAGEWVRVRTKFDIKLSEHGIKIPKAVFRKVNDTWNVSIDIYGTTALPKAAKPKSTK